MKSSVCFVHYSCMPGGIEIRMPALITGLKERTVKVFVIRPCNDVNLSIYKDCNVEVKYGSRVNFIAVVKFIIFVLKNRNCIFDLLNAGPYFLLVLNVLRIKKVVYGIHGTIYWKTNFQKLVRKIIWNLAISPKMVFIANTEYSSGVFTEHVSAKVIPRVLYNRIDSGRFNLKVSEVNKNEMKIVYVGRLVKSKNLDKWIEAAVYLIEQGVKAVFELYGIGPYENELRQLVNNSGYADKILMKGYVKEIERVYKEADLLLFLSSYESFGNVVVESVLCGTPVVAFDIPSMQEIFKDLPEFLIPNDENYKKNIFEKIKSISELKESAVKTSSVILSRFGSDEYFKSLNKIYADFA